MLLLKRHERKRQREEKLAVAKIVKEKNLERYSSRNQEKYKYKKEASKFLLSGVYDGARRRFYGLTQNATVTLLALSSENFRETS